ncbi:hypothetical protein SDC9_148027 [bioreactor metagenome]|uniref:Uncharacterized protein n=1 Tax=bioreactor metagenome TaxID=1076179 RepID=A0A645EI55_9ZZZZ
MRRIACADAAGAVAKLIIRKVTAPVEGGPALARIVHIDHTVKIGVGAGHMEGFQAAIPGALQRIECGIDCTWLAILAHKFSCLIIILSLPQQGDKVARLTGLQCAQRQH